MAEVEVKKDVPMEDDPVEKEQKRIKDEKALVLSDLRSNVTLCTRTHQTKEMRFLERVVRRLPQTRKQVNSENLLQLIKENFPQNSEAGKELKSWAELKSSMLNDSVSVDNSVIPEIHCYIHLLVLVFVLDKNRLDEAKQCADSLIFKFKLSEFNRRTLDPILAKAFFYYSRVYELRKESSFTRPSLHAGFRTSTLRHDKISQATIMNLILRNYLEYNLYDQAEKFLSKVAQSVDPNSTPTNQFVRYLYYTGRVSAIQLNYSSAYRNLTQAIRKAPQSTALGFKITAQKLLCIVQLLIGEIPEKTVFQQKGMINALTPYFDLSVAVRIGDLSAFQAVVKQNEETFRKDRNLALIQRLRRNVIKTGLRKINLSYSRIHLSDICTKLHLESVEDATFIVAKAIRDGVIDATIDFTGGFLQSKEATDIYSSQEPTEAFHKRIAFCIDTHNDAIKAMRYPDAKQVHPDEDERLERNKQEQIAKEITEDDDDEDLDSF